MPWLFRALLLAVALTCSAAAAPCAHAGDKIWVPPPPVPPTPPLLGQAPPSLSELRQGGFAMLVWTKSFQTAYLSMQVVHVIREASGQDASQQVFVETVLLTSHVSAFLGGGWGYALALDDGSYHARHRGLAIGLAEQTAYALLVGGLNLLGRQLHYEVNECHVPGVGGRGCIDHFYGPASKVQRLTMLWSAVAMGGLAIFHGSASARVKQLEEDGTMDGPAGDRYRKLRQPAVLPGRPKPTAALIPTLGGLALVGTF